MGGAGARCVVLCSVSVLPPIPPCPCHFGAPWRRLPPTPFLRPWLLNGCPHCVRLYAAKKLLRDHEREGFPITSVREVKLLRELNSPNIVNIVDIITSSETENIFILFEYMEHDLNGLMADGGIVLPPPHIKCYFQQILQVTPPPPPPHTASLNTSAPVRWGGSGPSNSFGVKVSLCLWCQNQDRWQEVRTPTPPFSEPPPPSPPLTPEH